MSGRAIKEGPFSIRPHIRDGAPSGKWHLDIPPHMSANGKRQRLLFYNKILAKEEARNRLKSINQAQKTSRSRHSASGYRLDQITGWWFEHEKSRVRTKKKSKSSLETNLHRLKPVLEFLGAADIGLISEILLVSYQEHRLEQGRKPSTINSELITLGLILKWACKNDFIRNVPRVEQIPVVLEDVEVPTPEEVVRIINALPKRLRPLVQLLAETGCRKGEALNLTWDDLDEVNGVIYIRPKKDGWSPKTHSSIRRVPIGTDLLGRIRRISKTSSYVFPGRGGADKPMNNFRKALASAVERANIERNGKLMQITPHLLRKAYITWQKEKGVDDAILQPLVGHARGSRVTLRHYMHATDKSKRNAVLELPKIDESK